MIYEYRVRALCGDSGFEVKKAREFPGEWYFERPSKFISLGPFQRPPKTVYLNVGFANEE